MLLKFYVTSGIQAFILCIYCIRILSINSVIPTNLSLDANVSKWIQWLHQVYKNEAMGQIIVAQCLNCQVPDEAPFYTGCWWAHQPDYSAQKYVMTQKMLGKLTYFNSNNSVQALLLLVISLHVHSFLLYITQRLTQNSHYFAEDIFKILKCNFVNDNIWIYF